MIQSNVVPPKVQLGMNLKSPLSVIGDNDPWNKFDISIGGWNGGKSQIRYDNAYAPEYLTELPHTWADFDGMRWNTVRVSARLKIGK